MCIRDRQEALSFNKNVYDCSYYSYDQMTKEEKESILLPVCYEKAVVKDKKASVVFTYANGDTYTGFNSAEIQNAGGSKLYTSQLGSSTMALSGDFVTSDGQKHISLSLIHISLKRRRFWPLAERSYVWTRSF